MGIINKFFMCLVFCCLVLCFPPPSTASDASWWDASWSYRQELVLSVDTSLSSAAFQPIDTTITFTEPCWAVNETSHSVRVVMYKNEQTQELSCQLYDLQFSSTSYLSSCCIVFLIPKEANGQEQYFVYFDQEYKPAPLSVDHVGVVESYYSYEHIPGYPFTSRYYGIIQDGELSYAISQEGEFMGYSTSQHVTKLKKGTQEVSPNQGEASASFDFRYYFGCMDANCEGRGRLFIIAFFNIIMVCWF